MDALEVMLRRQEGFKPKPYKDRSQYSVGYGMGVQHLPLDVQKRAWSEGLTEKESAQHMLDYARKSQGALANILGDSYAKLDRPRQVALESMIYNLGSTKFQGFKRMIGALRNGDLETAANEMLDSRWFRDPATSSRAKELSDIIRTGQYPSYVNEGLSKRKARRFL